MADPRALALLEAAFGGALPPTLLRLVSPDVSVADLIDFRANVVLSCGARRGPPRLAASDRGDPAGWRRAVVEQWPHPALEPFLDAVAPGTRRFVDSDGGEKAVVLLDDLLQPGGAQHGLAGPRGLPLLAASLELPSGARGSITLHDAPPVEHLPAELAAAAVELAGRSGGGRWAVRWRAEEPFAALWVTESRWRGTARETARLVDALDPPAGWRAVASAAEAAGLVAYPDGIQLGLAGACEVTVGLAPATAAATATATDAARRPDPSGTVR